jgi:tetratricopeptide (TPR) repeat protein
MQSSSFLSEFQRVLPPEIARLVYQTLRRDPLIWTSLQDDVFFQKVVTRSGEDPAGWSPAGLALLAAAEDLTLEKYTSPDMPALNRDLRQYALHAYDEIRRESKPPATLKAAGLAALALRERRRLTHSWQGMTAEMMIAPEQNPVTFAAAWRTPLACLYGMAPEPGELITNLLSLDVRWPAIELITHMLLCNPVDADTRASVPVSSREELFVLAAAAGTVEQQIQWLRNLQRLGEGRLAARLAYRLLEEQPDRDPVSWTQNDQPAASLHKAHDLAQWASLHRFAGQNEQAYALIEKAREATRRWMVGLNTQLTEIALVSGTHEPDSQVMEELIGAVQDSELMQNELTLTLGAYTQAKSLVEKTSEPAHPLAQIVKAATLASSDREAAQNMARKAASRLLKDVSGQLSQELSDLIYDWQPDKLVQTLFELDLIGEARGLAEKLLANRPTDLSLIGWLSLIFQKLGSLAESIEAARTALVLEPFDPDRHRRMADLWEAGEEWEQTFEERAQTLSLSGGDNLDDQLAYIHSAIRAMQLDQARTACAEILAENPDHGMTNAYLGWTLMEQGQLQEAINTLSKATLLIPETAQPWLLLSDAYRRAGETRRATETLRAGVLSAPDSPEINFSLASACLESGSPSEALPFLKKAATLTPNNLEVTLELGNTLFCLGHLTEARQVLGTARQKWISNPDLAYAFAQVLLALGEPEKAIPVFDVALLKEPPQFDWYLLYAEMLLGDWEALLSGQKRIDFAHLVNAQQALEKALMMNPEDFRAHLLLAETFSAKGRPDAAIEIYQRLVETVDNEAPAYCWRVQGGFGKVALQLGQVETALVALQEATCAESNKVYFLRLLTEAYMGADLKKEALQVARDAQRMAPNDLDTLSWFAEAVLQMGEAAEAVEALECATQLAPDDPDYWMRLAGLHMQIGNLDAARKAYMTLVDLDLVQPEHLQQAAYGYLRMEDRSAALVCLQRAVEMSPTPSAELLFETARLLLDSGQPEDALSSLQKAITRTPLDLKLHVFQSDLLVVLDRPQAALACLEHALQLKDAQNAAGILNEADDDTQSGHWMEALDNLAGIHARFARLLRKLGDLGPALLHAEKAFGLYPEDAVLRLVCASLALALMKWERVEELAAVDWKDIQHTAKNPGREAVRLAFLSLKVELALRNGQDHQAEAWLEELKDGGVDQGITITDTPRLMAAQACLAAHRGEWQVAMDLFDRAAALMNYTRQTGSMAFDPGIMLAVEDKLMMAEAAVEAQRWDEARRLSEQAVEEYPHEARTYFEYARKTVLIAERQRLCQDLGVKTNAPGAVAVSPETFAKLENTLNQAETLNGSPEIMRWSARGRAVFHPTYINARALMAVAKQPDEMAALAGVLRSLGNYPVAIQVAGGCGDYPPAVMQLALCLIETGAEKALRAARHALDLLPSEPMNYALLARAAEEVGDMAVALEALEAGLSLWPNEPEWHAWAAKLAVKAGVYYADVDHWNQAVLLDPNRIEYAMALTRAYLLQGEPLKAIEALNQPQYLEGENPEVWLLLAEAHQEACFFKEALQFSELAAEIDPSPKPVLRCGEIALAMESMDAALEYTQLALQRDPRLPEVVLFHAKVMKARGDLDAALEVIQRALPGMPDAMPVLLERARLIHEIEGPAAALELIQQVLKKEPESIEALVLLAHTQNEMGDFSQAEATIHNALRLDPTLADLNLLMGDLQAKAGQLDQAIHYFSEAIRQAPGMLPAYLELGRTYQQRREHPQALRTYEQAITIAPNDPRPYYQSALIMREGKDYIGAETMLRKASKLSPNDLSIRRQLGAIIALNLVHNSQEAQTAL